MKNILLSLSFISSILFAGCIKDDDVGEDITKCFNIYDYYDNDGAENSSNIITTKIMNKSFTLKVSKNILCVVYSISDENFTLINNENNKTVVDNENNAIEGDYDKNNHKVTFKVPNMYKNLTVLMKYKVQATPFSSKEDANNTSKDNFAVRPYKYNISIKKKSLKIGESTPIYLDVIDYKNNIVTDYSESSINLEANTTDNIPVQYSFDIKNGKSLPSAIIQFLKAKNNISVIFKDKNFAAIDADDTEDSCLDINGTINNIDITKNYKSWAGSSIQNSSNNPENKTISSKIKQNQNKDLHFQKMGW